MAATVEPRDNTVAGFGSSKPVRMNYATIHARPLPLAIHPLPPLIPHNPLSLIHFAIAYFTQLFRPPSSHRSELYRAYFSPETHSVHVTEEVAIRGLWENGFFGKGTLSRSEPSWLHREKRRLGIIVEETAEEITARRRAERKQFKQERARKEREEIERQHQEDFTTTVKPLKDDSPATEETPLLTAANKVPDAVTIDLQATGYSNAELSVTAPPSSSSKLDGVNLVDQEHLQLELVEAFFLVYAIGVLQIFDFSTKEAMTIDQLLHLCIAHATFPPLTILLAPLQAPPDNPFLVSYVAYHHFRSLGWVVRAGVKFGADLLLYNRGPVFAHAEFAVLVLPSYSHPYWASEEAARAYGGPRKHKPWHWLQMVNRVQTQVRKTIVLCYVTIPPPHGPELHDQVNVRRILERYRVREVVIKRWSPNRTRG